MTLKKLVNKQLAVFEAMCKLGYPSDDIYVRVHNGELFTELHQGEKRFHVAVSNKTHVNAEEYQTLWTRAAERWNSGMTMSERMRIYRAEFPTATKLIALTSALIAKGFDVPNLNRADA